MTLNTSSLRRLNKTWTIKIPELKTTVSPITSTFDHAATVDLLGNMLEKHKGRLLVITGAGLSTDSGIPDYRGDQGTYVRNPKHRPILYNELVSSHSFRQRYWSRSYLGWPKMETTLPNGSHYSLTSLLPEYVQNIITQNVDHLHTKANTPSDHLLELHGTLYSVECMECGQSSDRPGYQHRINARNPEWIKMVGTGKVNPDGDVELPNGISYHDFDIPPCLHCGSQMMKPKVVFFGESIKPEVTERAERYVNESSAVLVIGSSLATYSSYRLVRMAHKSNKPIAALSKGPTRADDILSWKAEVGCTPILQQLVSHLIGSSKKDGLSMNVQP
ncbi:DHS-like NAD/FAD-binding domain-containing protein [Pilobolus umbonatus]|nr:DHS-like NAD/FAD-binding domain-containing protein [Pilobolus umbonatus]